MSDWELSTSQYPQNTELTAPYDGIIAVRGNPVGNYGVETSLISIYFNDSWNDISIDSFAVYGSSSAYVQITKGTKWKWRGSNIYTCWFKLRDYSNR